MPDTMNGEVVDVAETDAIDTNMPNTETEQVVEEKLSAQLLRRVHEDTTILIEDYDEVRSLLENENVDAFLVKKLEALVSELEEIEALFEQEHPELHQSAPLGGGAKNLGEDGEIPGDEANGQELEDAEEDENSEMTADSSDELPEPSPDEVVEGMDTDQDETKGKKYLAVKGKYSKSMMKCKGGKGCKCAKCDKKSLPKKKALTDDEKEKIKDDIDKEAADTEKRLKGKKKAIPGEEEDTKVGEDFSDEHIPNEPGMEENQDKPGMNVDTLSKALEPHEWNGVHGAKTYLKAIGEKVDFTDEDRFEAYHHAKTLQGFSEMAKQEDAVELADGQKFIPAAAAAVGGEIGAAEAVQIGMAVQDQDKSLHPHRQKCMGASKFLKGIATTKNFGESHRIESKAWHKELDELDKQPDEAEIQEPESTDDIVPEDMEDEKDEDAKGPGDIDEKSANRLKALFESQEKMAKLLDKQLAALNGKLVR